MNIFLAVLIVILLFALYLAGAALRDVVIALRDIVRELKRQNAIANEVFELTRRGLE